MRTKNLFRTLVTAALAVFSTSAFAQYSLLPTANGGTPYTVTSEYATVGSRMPYFVTPDATIVALQPAQMQQSEFRWRFLNGGNAAVMTTPPAVLDVDAGATPATAGTGGAPYYEGNEISVVWAAKPDAGVAQGDHWVVEAMEHSIPFGGVFADGCDGSVQTRNVYVIDAPTISVSATAYKACNFTLGNTFYIPYTATGVENWSVSYTLSINGGAAAANTANGLNSDGSADAPTDVTILTAPQVSRNMTGTPGATTYGIPITTTVYGQYAVTITDITDRISRKAMNTVAGTITAGTYTFYLVPTPTTNAIQHRDNVGW
jgi:hypothetical protein